MTKSCSAHLDNPDREARIAALAPHLCRPRRPDEVSTGWSEWLDLIPMVPDRSELRVGDANWRDTALLHGWFGPEGSHVWNSGNSELVLRVAPDQQASVGRIELTLTAMLDHGLQRYAISSYNGRFAVEGVADSTAPFMVRVPLVANAEGIVRLRLSAETPVTPQSQGLNPDMRGLGLNLIAIRLVH
jgi:hypothetical protein